MLLARLKPCEQVGAVVGGEEVLQRAGAGDDEGEVVVAGHGEAGVDHVVADALVAEVDLEAVVEEGEEVAAMQPSSSCS